MSRKEEKQSESLEERRIACRERFEEAVTEGRIQILREEFKKYIELSRDNYSILSLAKQGFNYIRENCRPPQEEMDQTSWQNWRSSLLLSEVVTAFGDFYASTASIYRKAYGNVETISKSMLDESRLFLQKILSITDAGENVLDDRDLKLGVESLIVNPGIACDPWMNFEGRAEFEKFDYLFKKSAREFLTLEKEKAIEEKNLFKLWVIADRFLDLGKDYDRDMAWMTIDEAIKIGNEIVFDPQRAKDVLISSFWIFDISAEFDFSENGDFTLFEKAKKLMKTAMAACSFAELSEGEKSMLASARGCLKAILVIGDKSKRMRQEIEGVVKEIDEFISGGQRAKMASRSVKTTFLSRLTGRLTRNMAGEMSEKPKALKPEDDLRFIDGSSAKVLQVYNGGETIVYKVENNVGRICAMRVYRGTRGKDFGIERGRFVNALRSQVSKQTKDCIPEVYDYKVAREGIVYVSQEFIEGENLEKVAKPIAEEDIKSVAVSLIFILGETHQNSKAHLDIKPSNLIMTEEGKVAVLDWDLAREFGQEYSQKGTVEYVSPEVCLGIGKVDGKADIYSFGVTLYELFTGETQALSPDGRPLFKASFEQRFPKINEVPEKWQGIIEKCVNLDPVKRPTANELLLSF